MGENPPLFNKCKVNPDKKNIDSNTVLVEG